MFGFGFHTLGAACNRELRLRLVLGRVEQFGACTSLLRICKLKADGILC